MRSILTILVCVMLCSCAVRNVKSKTELVKGVYGNPETLLKAGYRFDSLGMNAVFVRSGSLTPAFFNTAKEQGCQVFVEFPTLNGSGYLKAHPEAWPINEKGERAPPADWFMGVCPTNTAFKQHRIAELKKILQEYDVDGIFLDYVHLHAQFETVNPILPETCFCNNCISEFSAHTGLSIPGADTKAKARWILDSADVPWRVWRTGILTGWVTDMKDMVRSQRPDAKLGVFYCAWYPQEFDSALHRILGIDVKALATQADVLAPMLFHRMMGKDTEWVGEYVAWLGGEIRKKKLVTKIWPIVQADNKSGPVSPEEFLKVMINGSKAPASGIMMFADQSLLEDPEKLSVMKTLYRK